MKSACCSTSPLRKEIKLHLYQSVKSFPMLGKWRHRLNISRSDDLHISMSKKTFLNKVKHLFAYQQFNITAYQQINKLMFSNIDRVLCPENSGCWSGQCFDRGPWCSYQCQIHQVCMYWHCKMTMTMAMTKTHKDQYKSMTNGQPYFLKTFLLVLKTIDRSNSCQKEAWWTALWTDWWCHQEEQGAQQQMINRFFLQISIKIKIVNFIIRSSSSDIFSIITIINVIIPKSKEQNDRWSKVFQNK